MIQGKEEILLKTGENLEDLQLNNLQIIQNRNLYCFTSDSVLLSNFVKVGHNDNVLELCSGCGVISILVNEKCKPKTIVGLEIDSDLCDMSRRSLIFNKINNIEFICEDIKNILNCVKRQSKDVVICNPPYFLLKKDEIVNPKYLKAKYETTIKIDEIFKSCDEVLKFGGKFFMCFTPTRLQELLVTASKYKFTLKKIQFVYPKNKQKLSTLVLCMFAKNGNPNCEVLQNILV